MQNIYDYKCNFIIPVTVNLKKIWTCGSLTIFSYLRKYDLKGSTVDREASSKEKGKEFPTLKDNDFIKDGMKVFIGEEAKTKLLEQLQADVEVNLITVQDFPYGGGRGLF